MPHMALRVFVSAASQELAECRDAVADALIQDEVIPRWQRAFAADPRTLLDYLEHEIGRCDAVVCVVGEAFGDAPPRAPGGQERSYSQYEYDVAVKLGKPVYVLMTDHRFTPARQIVQSDERRLLQAAHRQALGRRHAARDFGSCSELVVEIVRLARQLGRPPARRGAPASDVSLTGELLGPYRLDAEIGSGGMGRVYRAVVEGRAPALATGSVVAVKVVHPRLLEEPGFFKRFLREGELGRRVVHENVVRTYDVDAAVAAGVQHHYLVVEYVDGQTLAALRGELGRVPEHLCRHIGREIAKGLAAIHAAGAVHRDLKPENALITRAHAVKIMDLGVARFLDDAARLSQPGVFVGSLPYSAPEQFQRGGIDVDARTDLHALGVVLYELASGVHPFPGRDFAAISYQVVHEPPRPIGDINPQLSPFFEELLTRLLQKDREKRFASAAELARVLDEGEESNWWKGRANAVRSETKRPLRRIRIPREAALVGRDTALARLRELYARAKAGDGNVVLVEGEAGIGKSRLVDEFVGLLQREGEDINFLFGSYPPGGAATASGAFSTAYREQFGAEGLEETLKDYLKPTPILVRAFAALLRGEPTPAGAEPLSKDSLQTCFVHAARALAAERPTVVLIDDLHFAPEEGRALFASLALAVPGHRVLLVGTTRPGIDEKWLAQLTRLPQTSRLAVARLTRGEIAALLADALKSTHLAEDLAPQIAEKTDGNPHFVFEILRDLRDRRVLAQKDDGTWVATQVIRDIRIPSSIEALIAARIADLPEEDRELLQVAACCGFEFDPLLVGSVLGTGQIPLMRRLAHIEARHRLVRSAGRRYVFDHHQVVESLYAGMPELLREPYHAAIGDALERQHDAAAKEPGEIDGALAVDLAEHFLKGAQGARALRYLDPALTHLEKGYLNEAAVRLMGRALTAPSLLAGGPRVEMLLRKARRLDLLGRSGAERAALEEAILLADVGGKAALRVRARNALGWHLVRVARYAEAETTLAAALEFGHAARDRRLVADSTGNLGGVFNGLGRYEEARAAHERHLVLAREVGDRGGEARATGNLGLVHWSLGHLDDARELYEQRLALSLEVGDRRGEANAIGSLAALSHAAGRFVEARDGHERCIAIDREIGDRLGEAVATVNLGNLFVSLGRYQEADVQHSRSLALAREIDARQTEAIALLNLGITRRWLGDAPAAAELCAQALALSREIGLRDVEAATLRAVGEAAAECGADDEAERSLRTARDLLAALESRDDDAGGTARTLGALLLRTGRRDEGLALLEEALGSAKEERPDLRTVALAELAAGGVGNPADAIRALAEDETRIGIPERIEARFLLWQATPDHDRTHLAEAKRLLDFMVAHAPPDCRESMLANVRLHREIAAAAKAAGL